MSSLPPPVAKRAPAPIAAPPSVSNGSAKQFGIVSGPQPGAQRVVAYGPGGVGKSSLAALLPGVVFLDIEDGTRALDVPRISGIETFADLRSVINGSTLDGFGSVVIDSATKAEELAIAHALATIPHEKGHMVTSLEGYGFGKGYQHAYDTFLLLLQDCDRLVRRGKNVILLAHECVTDVPNPSGEDWIRYEPRLQCPKSGKASIRDRVFEWSDHVLFIGYDVVATNDGKGKGAGTRTIYPQEMPTHRAKSRTVSEPIAFPKGDSTIWQLILGGVQ